MAFSQTRRALLGGAALLVASPALLRAQSRTLNLYSSRHYDTDEALYSDFTKQTGIAINRVEAGEDPLLARMQSEGANSPADVLITVDAGRIEKAQGLGLLQPFASETLASRIPANLRDPDGNWFGFSTRARVFLVAKDKVAEGAIASYEDLADPKWKGKVLIRSSINVYNQSLTGSVLAAHGPEKTETWARGVVANMARPPRGGDTDQIRAAAAGEGDVAVANTYYFGRLALSSKPEDKAVVEKLRVVFPNQGDRGTHVNISAAGIARHAKNIDAAKAFLEYLSTPSAQRYFAFGNSEYPVVAGVEPPPHVAAWGKFKVDALNARVFARNNAEALKIMDRAGWK
ncbi:MAG: Fe(3+) ABC transporter substrate-binding protein [Phreatobacter sp.]|uniref:Fe(3+) ABC transporter substrate-binding protein n=1 Tax=Phreatobacter sp. TaxID=1966341 RepID=UPI0040373A11